MYTIKLPGLKEKLKKCGKVNGPKCPHLKKKVMKGIKKINLGNQGFTSK